MTLEETRDSIWPFQRALLSPSSTEGVREELERERGRKREGGRGRERERKGGGEEAGLSLQQHWYWTATEKKRGNNNQQGHKNTFLDQINAKLDRSHLEYNLNYNKLIWLSEHWFKGCCLIAECNCWAGEADHVD